VRGLNRRYPFSSLSPLSIPTPPAPPVILFIPFLAFSVPLPPTPLCPLPPCSLPPSLSLPPLSFSSPSLPLPLPVCKGERGRRRRKGGGEEREREWGSERKEGGSRRKEEEREGGRKYSNHSSSKFFGISTVFQLNLLLLWKNPLPRPAQTPPPILGGSLRARARARAGAGEQLTEREREKKETPSNSPQQAPTTRADDRRERTGRPAAHTPLHHPAPECRRGPHTSHPSLAGGDSCRATVGGRVAAGHEKAP
jgi:hypothetical protein